jgi:copper(I)-binding protein
MNRFLIHTAAAALFAMPAFAYDGFAVRDAYARVSTPSSLTGAAFLVLENHQAIDDTLIAVRSDTAVRVELHTHIEDENGIMRMMEIESGITIAAGGEHALDRGGDHIMFMGLAGRWAQGDIVHVTLVFEHAGELEIDIPVDLARQPAQGMHDTMQMHGHTQ